MEKKKKRKRRKRKEILSALETPFSFFRWNGRVKKKTEKIGRSGTPNEEANGITRTLKSEAE